MSLEQAPFQINEVVDAEKLIARDDSETVISNVSAYYGDHWQSAAMWRGPLPSATEDGYQTLAQAVEAGFVSKNTIKEITDRAMNALLGKDFKFTLSYEQGGPGGRQQNAKLREAEDLLRKWMKKADATKYVQKSLRHAMLAGKAPLRLFVPPGMLKDGGIEVNQKNPLRYLFLDAPSPLSAGFVMDDNTREAMGVFLGQTVDADNNNRRFAECHYLLPVENEEGERITEISVLPERGFAETAQLDLDGRLLLHEIEFPRLVTEQVRQLQMFQNLNLTMMQRNSVLGGFLERTILNGQMPGEWTTDETGKKVFVPDPRGFIVGAGSVNVINGNPLEENGETTGYTPASIVYKNPIPVTTFSEAIEIAYRSILEEAQQLHALLAGDAQDSGDSRRQALAQFVAALRIPKQQAENAIQWMLETVLMVAGNFSGDPDRFRGISVKAECKLDLGPLATGETDLIERQVRVGLISLKTGRERLGIENLEEEEKLVEEGLATVERAVATFQSNPRLDNGIDNRDKLRTTQE
jgi:hypothetical protein